MTQRTALVTGGSRGIGQAIAGTLRERGVSVTTPPREELDLADAGSVRAWCDRHAGDQYDILVNNAGINELRLVQDLDEATWDLMEQINLRAPLQLMRMVAPGMMARGWGRIVNITSVWAHVARERRAGYAATKAALSSLTRSLALECAAKNVLVNAVSPGFVATALTRKNNSPQEIAALCTKIPVGRLAEPEEIAKTVAWLASEDNSYITGQTILADGGYTLV